MSDQPHTGGCQCGAVRFRATELGRPSLCHCRMCQKATAGIGGLLVLAKDLVWTRGAPKYFASSNIARRGFCGDCGTPLSYETDDGADISIVALDQPDRVPPLHQLAREARIPWADRLASLPERSDQEMAASKAREASIISYQHPDHDTKTWKVRASGATEWKAST
jgi:hypothetical protein